MACGWLTGLILSESNLRLVAPNINTTTKDLNHLPSALTKKLKNQFNDLAVMKANGEVISLINQNKLNLKISHNDINHVSSGKTSIFSVIDGITQSSQLWMAIPLNEQQPKVPFYLGNVA